MMKKSKRCGTEKKERKRNGITRQLTLRKEINTPTVSDKHNNKNERKFIC